VKKWDRRRVKPQPKFRQPRWLVRHFREIGFVPRKDGPKDVVVAGLGFVEIKERSA
jgi:hypothetical protein